MAITSNRMAPSLTSTGSPSETSLGSPSYEQAKRCALPRTSDWTVITVSAPVSSLTLPPSILPTRILGPCMSSITPMGRPASSAALRTAVTAPRRSSCVPCVKLSRATSLPTTLTSRARGPSARCPRKPRSRETSSIDARSTRPPSASTVCGASPRLPCTLRSISAASALEIGIGSRRTPDFSCSTSTCWPPWTRTNSWNCSSMGLPSGAGCIALHTAPAAQARSTSATKECEGAAECEGPAAMSTSYAAAAQMEVPEAALLHLGLGDFVLFLVAFLVLAVLLVEERGLVRDRGRLVVGRRHVLAVHFHRGGELPAQRRQRGEYLLEPGHHRLDLLIRRARATAGAAQHGVRLHVRDVQRERLLALLALKFELHDAWPPSGGEATA